MLTTAKRYKKNFCTFGNNNGMLHVNENNYKLEFHVVFFDIMFFYNLVKSLKVMKKFKSLLEITN